SPGFDLCADGDEKNRGKNQCSDDIAQIHGHRDGVAARFAQSCGGNLDYPEIQGHLWNFAQRALGGYRHVGIRLSPMKERVRLCALMILALGTISLTMAAASTEYKVANTWKLGGDGGWDYLTADGAGHRLFISRSTRVMVIDTESGKQVGEI